MFAMTGITGQVFCSQEMKNLRIWMLDGFNEGGLAFEQETGKGDVESHPVIRRSSIAPWRRADRGISERRMPIAER
jgi:hypothetical protein